MTKKQKPSQNEDLNLTSAQGTLISDDQNSLKIGDQGPLLLENFPFREKLFHFDRRRHS
ncbi:catalase [Coxiella endosymbiont of Ornithodoros maritimus]|uniref:catalase n=1 Tax=Coxiella endosymbiont of Ornithodoros maritimus TaxID=1656172 RepID=UPI002B40021E|nr:catalase [Coxiella endosymbiont of Ornithodoros maritimus]